MAQYNSFLHAVTDSDLPMTQRFLCIILWKYSDFKGQMWVWPSVETLASDMGCNERTVRRAMRDLEERGIVKVSRIRDPQNPMRNLGNRYQIQVGHFASVPVDDNLSGDADNMTGYMRTICPQHADNMTGKLKKRTKEDRTISRSSDKSVAEKKPDMTGFIMFWTAYPRKVGKPAAEKAWAKAIMSTPVETIMAGLSRYIAERQRDSRSKVEMLKFTAHPATWLNQERWNDVVEVDDASF